MEDRPKALEWWRILLISEKIDIINKWKETTKSGFKKYTPDMIATSSAAIETIWRETIKNA